MAKLGIRFSKSAVKDLKSIQEYIYADNPAKAKEVVKHIIGKIEDILAENPSAGKAGRVLGTRELVIAKYPYIVPYQVKDDVVFILRVLHTSRIWA